MYAEVLSSEVHWRVHLFWNTSTKKKKRIDG